ncbi:hypothetical protein [Amycolatopsis samaneae]|uniref:PE domain-containing protein n=1 Tax=Amycolatopsis samaneae TaxID=664691 RepID=A0ABW5GJ05_9PSEU
MSFTPGSKSKQAEDDYCTIRKNAAADEDLRASLPGGPPQASPVATSTSGGAGYQVDPEGLAAQIRAFEALRNQSQAMQQQLREAAGHATPPSLDPPAVRQAMAARDSLLSAADQNKAMAMYAQGLIDSMRKANGTYAQRDEDVSATLRHYEDNTVALFGKDAGR